MRTPRGWRPFFPDLLPASRARAYCFDCRRSTIPASKHRLTRGHTLTLRVRAERVGGRRITTTRPAWTRSLDDWDRQYEISGYG